MKARKDFVVNGQLVTVAINGTKVYRNGIELTRDKLDQKQAKAFYAWLCRWVRG